MEDDVRPPRGTQDLVPPVSERYTRHVARSAELFDKAGYRRIIGPTFEDTALFERGVGAGSDIVRKEMYTFTDRSGNSLTLRPEGTAAALRTVISEHLWDEGLPVKVWYEAAMFRYDRPQKGRFREHHQLGVEAIGSGDPALDAEVIEMGAQMLARAGVGETTLLLNSIGHPGCRAEYMPALTAFLDEQRDRLDEECHQRIVLNPLRVFDCKNPDDQKVLAAAPSIDEWLCADCRSHFEAVQGWLKDAGIDYERAPRMVRGLDYYTRTAFEFQTPLLQAAQSTVCAGGRYDLLCEQLGGPDLPGIGFGSGIERILIAAEAAGVADEPYALGCFVVPLGEDERAAAVALARALRAAGVSADLAYVERGLKAQMKQANKTGARYVALIGAKEREAGVATVRDMESGEQTAVAFGDVPAWLEERVR
ncbi:MAG TPA: histidine--tRNA ligase [Actinomycetota bacterium]